MKLFMMGLSRKQLFFILAILLLAAGWKIWLLTLDAIPFNADEAIVGLMGRHILAGERPVFFYGQAYMGSLDAYFAALGFALFGAQVWVIRLIQILLYLGTIISTVVLGKLAFSSVNTGILAALLLAIPTVNVTLYTSASLGGYGEALFIGNLLLIFSLKIVSQIQDRESEGLILRNNFRLFFGWSFLAGLGLWANGLTLVYSIPSGILILTKLLPIWRHKGWIHFLKYLGFGVGGFFIGSLPWWLFAFTQGVNSLITELLGRAVAVDPSPWLEQVWNHLVNFSLLGLTVTFGFRPPWGITWLGLPILPFVVIVWVIIFVFLIRQLKNRRGNFASYCLLTGVILTLIAGFLFTAFGIDPSGRYFLPFLVPFALVTAECVRSFDHIRIVMFGIVVVLILFQAWGTVQSAFQNPPGITTQFNPDTVIDQSYLPELSDFLQAQGETLGYATYWVSYPLAFQSDEKLIFIPRLPYHSDLRYTSRDDRYPPYTKIVDNAQRTSFITARTPALDIRLTAEFKRLGITWKEKSIGDFRVFYGLSRLVKTDEMDLYAK